MIFKWRGAVILLVYTMSMWINVCIRAVVLIKKLEKQG